MSEKEFLERYISPKTLFDWYISMQDQDQIRFERMLQKHREDVEASVIEQRKKILDEMRKLTDPDGKQYFSETYLKKYLGIS